ncbi:ComEC/Rec2 family competence protein [Burkholderia sp. 22PA0099]|uniref:ComEC/Rec2 family competence protein n=1 Tax=Burkholderia sp. 22PA0099 TaxID=3237372 RepID=UPI0039C0BD64
MREIWIAFALGVVLLQRQASLPEWRLLAALGLAVGLLIALVLVLFVGPTRWAGRACVPAALALALLAGFSYAAVRAHWRLADTLPAEWMRRDAIVTGTVRGLPARDADGMRFVFDVDGHDTGLAHFPARLRLSWIVRGGDAVPPPPMRPGERWRLRVRLKRPHGAANDGVRDAEAGWLAQGVRALGYVSAPRDAIRLDAGPRTPRDAVDRLRFALRERVRTVLAGAPHAGIVIALAIGAQDDITEADRRSLRATGTSHLVAISGLHIGMVGALAGWGVAAWWRRAAVRGMPLPLIVPAQYAGACAAIAGAGCYAALAGFNVPAQRAWWMLSTACLAYLAGRAVPPSATLAMALAGVLIADPWAVLLPGFWLSFGAVAVILFAVSGRTNRRRHRREGEPLAADADMGVAQPRRAIDSRRWVARLAHGIASGARVQYAVTLWMVPLGVVWFGQIPLGGMAANALAIPWVGSLVTPVVLAGVVLPAPLDALAFHAAHAMLAALFGVFDALGPAERSVLTMAPPSGFALAAALIGGGWMLMPHGWLLRFAAPLAWLPFALPAPQGPPAGAARLTMLDVGQGTSVLVETAHHRLLFDAGPGEESTRAGERVVVPFLRARGIDKLDVLMISHADADHAGGAPAVLAALPVAQLAGGLPPGNRLWRQAKDAGVADRLVCAAGQHWQWDGVRFAVLWPQGGVRAGSANAQSCVLHVSAVRHAALLTGDIDTRVERVLLAGDRAALAADVLVVPHHGSRTSSSEPFVDAVGPRTAWFPLGYANRFRHPHPTVWARFAERGIPLARSDRDGQVEVMLNDPDAPDAPDALPILRYRDRHRRYWMDR